MLKKLKSLDIITILLLIFILAIPGVFFTFQTINSNIQLFSKQSDIITKLKLLDKDFHYFASQKGVFHNYDNINQKIESFQQTLALLKSYMQKNNNNKNYIAYIDKIALDFQKKVNLIEHIKSYNSIIINTLNYLHDLEKNIQTHSPVTEKELALLNTTLFLSMQFYTNNNSVYNKTIQNIKKIKTIAEHTQDKYIDYFYKHENELITRIAYIKKEKTFVHQLNIYQRLDNLYQKLQSDFHNYLFLGKAIMLFIMFFLASLLMTILYFHRKSVEQKKELSAYKYAIENSDNSIVITDLNKNITFVNEAFEKETGYSKEEAIGQNPRILKSDLLNKEHYESLNYALENQQKWEGEFINKRKDGTIYYEKASIGPMFVDDKVIGYIAIKLNITKYIEQERKVKFLAYHDPLTSLPNRHQFEQYFRDMIFNKNKKVALFYIDLDHFKNINDTLGHHAGDELLKVFAKRLRAEISHQDFIARIGGDEFIAIINLHDTTDLEKIANRILTSLHSPIHIQGQNLNITTSIGIARFPEDGKTLESLLKHADTAMYKAKTDGRNNFHFFTQQLSDKAYERLTIEQELRQALKKNELYMVYQPKYQLDKKEIIGFEALIRWENEKLGFVSPDKFIYIAEEIGLINEIGYFVFEQACKDFNTFKAIHDSLKHIAINVSTIQLEQKNFIDTINQITKKYALSPSNIEIEVTETYVMKNIEKNIQRLGELRENGYQIAIDDFGTGYSSFAYLKKLPITTLKIDKSFIDDICKDIKDKNIVNTIITLADNLGFNTVAEGVEYHNQEKLLVQMGCQTAQGYIFSKPLKAKEITDFIYSRYKDKMFV
jgi:diguanylate cyclase (GGDEF)-like protein/PAS domain S-box-containing protein